MLTLKLRPAKIGSSINTRSEIHGDETVAAADIPLTEMMLTREELNAVMCDPHAYEALFDKKANSPDEPMFKQLKPLKLKDKIENATVRFIAGLNGVEVKLAGVNLARVELEPKVGGLTAMSCQIQCTPNLDDDSISILLSQLNHEVEAEITCEGYGDQAQLPLADSKRGKKGKDQPAAH